MDEPRPERDPERDPGQRAAQDPLFDLTEKVCTRCKQAKPLDAFNRCSRSPDGHQPHCRDCSKAYYQANRERHLRNVARRRREHRRAMRRKVLEYLDDHPCVDCGESDPVVLEFDHVRGEKIASIAEMIRVSRPWRAIEAEIRKCEVRCANCHRRRTARVAGWYETVRERPVPYVAYPACRPLPGRRMRP